MIRFLLLSLQVRFSITANRLLHFLKSLPGLKKMISSDVYGNDSLKKVFTILGAIFIANKKLVVHLIYIGFLLIFGAGLHQMEVHGGIYALFSTEGAIFDGLTTDGVIGYMLLIWFILSVIGGLTSSTIASEGHKNDDILINCLRTPADVYSHARILFARVVDLVLFTPTLLLAFALAKIPLWGVATTLIMYTAFRLSGEVASLIMYRRIGKTFGTQSIAIVTSLLLLTAAIVLPPHIINSLKLPMIFANPVTAAIFVPIGIFDWLYIKKYPLYRPLLKEKIRWYNDAMVNAQQQNTTLNFKDASKWSESITKEDLRLDKHADKTGLAYLNAIFFDRHDKYFKKKLRQRNCIFLALPVIALLFVLYSRIRGEVPATLFENIDLRSLFNNITPVFFFVIYTASMGKTITASVFSNCDIHMLHYPYYRVKETILASFKARFTVALHSNFIVTTLMFFSVISVVWLLFGHMNFMYAGIFFMMLSFAGVFFAFNDLFLYYVIQPYDSAGKGKSPVYSIINAVIYMIAYMSISGFRSDFILFSIIIVIATILYMGIGLVLLLFLAPKNFRLR